MSRPLNPLSKFRSYSYYHVLAVCDSTETAEALSTATDPEKWRHPTGPQAGLPDPRTDSFNALGQYAVKFLEPSQGKGKYCVLINGATDAALSIVRAKWDSVTAAQATVLDQTTSVAVEGELEISEPKGIIFFDVLVNCCLAMGVDAANAVFVLKTFFVGYPDMKSDTFTPGTNAADISPSTGETIINDIEPIRFIAYDMTGSFAETGGYYKMSFVAISYGVSRLPQFSKSASGFSFKAGTLQEAVQKLAGVVEKNYDRLFECVEDSVRAALGGGDDTDADAFVKKLSRVKYEFALDKQYTSTEYMVSDEQPVAKDIPGCDKPATLTFPANMSIEDALHLIMKHCKQVQEDMSKGIEVNGSKRRVHYEYKIHTTYESKQEGDKMVHIVKYLIKPYERPRDVNLFNLASSGTEVENLKKNTIEFDYLYTGKNIDILEFDIKMNMGLQYLQIATINNSLKDQLQGSPSSIKHVSKHDIEQLGRFGQIAHIPVMFGTQVRAPSMKNVQSVSTSAEAGYSMNKHASIEVQDANMKIYGNPRLLNSVNRTTGPKNFGQGEEPNGTDGSFYNWANSPAFAKVNIKMPQHNDDIALFRQDVDDFGAGAGLNYTKDFWFTGYYYVVGITHEFDGGEFTQTLSMVGIPESSAAKALNAKSEEGMKLPKAIGTCYDNAVDPCKAVEAATATGGTPSSVVVPHARPVVEAGQVVVPNTVVPTTLEDSIAAYNGKVNPDSVTGWKNADLKVKSAVINAANKHNVSVGDMAVMAAAESNFKADVRNSLTQNATGLYQFTKETWFGTKPGYGVISQFGDKLGISHLSTDEQDKARTDPNINAEAAVLMYKQSKDILKTKIGKNYEPTMYDMYLSHFAGPAVAAAIIKECSEGRGNTPTERVYAKLKGVRYTSMIRDNPEMAKYYTAAQFRDAIRQKLDRRLGGVSAVQPQSTPVDQSTTTASPLPTSQASTPSQPVAVVPVSPSLNITADEKAAKAKSCTEQKKATEDKKTSCNQTPAAPVEQASNVDPSVGEAAGITVGAPATAIATGVGGVGEAGEFAGYNLNPN